MSIPPFTGPEHATLRCRAAITNRHELLLYPAWRRASQGEWIPLPGEWAKRICISNFPEDGAALIYDVVITGELEVEISENMQHGVRESIPYAQKNLKLQPVSLIEHSRVINLQQGYANCIHRVLFRSCPSSMFLTNATYSIKYLCGTLTETFYPVSIGDDYVEMLPIHRLDDTRGYVICNGVTELSVSNKVMSVSNKVMVLDCKYNNLFLKASEAGEEKLVETLLREQPNIDQERPLSLQELREKFPEAEAEKERKARRKVETESLEKVRKEKPAGVEQKPKVNPPEGWGVFWLPPNNYEKKTCCDREYYVIHSMEGVPFKIRQGLDCNLDCSRTLNAAHEGCCGFDVSCYKLMMPVFDDKKWFFDICVNRKRYTYSCLVEHLRMAPDTTNAYGKDCKRLFLNVERGVFLDRNGYDIENLKLELEQSCECDADDKFPHPLQNYLPRKKYIIIRNLQDAEFDINAAYSCNLSCSRTLSVDHEGCCWFDIFNEKLYHPDFDGEKWFFDMYIRGVRRVYSCPVWQLRRLNTISTPNGLKKRFYVRVEDGRVEDRYGYLLSDVNLSLEFKI